jgi:hypothetical protein
LFPSSEKDIIRPLNRLFRKKRLVETTLPRASRCHPASI